MSLWSQYRMIDILSQFDPEMIADEIPERDLERPELCPEKKHTGGVTAAVISGIAAGSLVLTGAVVLICRRHEIFRRAA